MHNANKYNLESVFLRLQVGQIGKIPKRKELKPHIGPKVQNVDRSKGRMKC